MEDENFTVELKCLFCDCPLKGDPNQEFSSGDLIKCQNCNELNDYDALLDVAAEEGITIIKDHLDDHLKKHSASCSKINILNDYGANC